MIEGNCEYCGKAFRRNRGSKKGKDAGRFCSRECASAARKEENTKRKLETSSIKTQTVKEFTCSFCGKTFISERKRKYCSIECRKESDKIRNKLLSNQKRPLQFVSKKVKCRWCGKIFKTEFKKSKVFCSEDCKKAHSHFLKKFTKNRFKGNIVDRDITLEKLIKRDNGICQICGLAIDKTDYQIIDGNFITGGNYPSIDHIYPLSRGGLHEWCNVQLAHFRCNTIKNNKIDTGQG